MNVCLSRTWHGMECSRPPYQAHRMLVQLLWTCCTERMSGTTCQKTSLICHKLNATGFARLVERCSYSPLGRMRTISVNANANTDTNTIQIQIQVLTYGKLLLQLGPPQQHAHDLHSEDNLLLDQGLLQIGVKLGNQGHSQRLLHSVEEVLEKCN